METTRDTFKSDVQRLIACFFALLAQPRTKLDAFKRAVRALEDRVRRWLLGLACVRDGLCTEDIQFASAQPSEAPAEINAPRLRAPRRPGTPTQPGVKEDPIHLADLAHWLSRLRTLADLLDNPDAALHFVRPHLRPDNYSFAPSFAPDARSSLIDRTESLFAAGAVPTMDELLAPYLPAPDSS